MLLFNQNTYKENAITIKGIIFQFQLGTRERKRCFELEIIVDHLKHILELSVNFTNILHAFFCSKVLCEAFLYLHFRFELFWRKNIGANALIKYW
jgi:hypothetical protein